MLEWNAMVQRTYQQLIAWQEAHKLCLSVYGITKKFPVDERYRLVNQMCKSAYSVPMNIAEGNAKRSFKEKARFFEIALGSLEELHYQYFLCRDLGYLSQKDFSDAESQIIRVSYLLTKLRAAFQ